MDENNVIQNTEEEKVENQEVTTPQETINDELKTQEEIIKEFHSETPVDHKYEEAKPSKLDSAKFWILTVSLVVIIGVVIFMVAASFMDDGSKPSRHLNDTTLDKKLFDGYEAYVLSETETNYDMKAMYEEKLVKKGFHDGVSVMDSSIAAGYREMEFKLEDGKLIAYDKNSPTLTYTFAPQSKITNFITMHSCSAGVAAILALDEAGNVYKGEFYEVELYELATSFPNMKKVEGVSNVQEILAYDFFNEPEVTCGGWYFLYRDDKEVIRNLDNNNKEFYKSQHYYSTESYAYHSIVVGNDGLLYEDADCKTLFKVDGKEIKYKASFVYTDDNVDNGIIYVISDDGYLYEFPAVPHKLDKASGKKIVAVGYNEEVVGENSKKQNVLVQFEDGTTKEFKDMENFHIVK